MTFCCWTLSFVLRRSSSINNFTYHFLLLSYLEQCQLWREAKCKSIIYFKNIFLYVQLTHINQPIYIKLLSPGFHCEDDLWRSVSGKASECTLLLEWEVSSWIAKCMFPGSGFLDNVRAKIYRLALEMITTRKPISIGGVIITNVTLLSEFMTSY